MQAATLGFPGRSYRRGGQRRHSARQDLAVARNLQREHNQFMASEETFLAQYGREAAEVK
jgi:hypothetical protein